MGKFPLDLSARLFRVTKEPAGLGSAHRRGRALCAKKREAINSSGKGEASSQGQEKQVSV